MSSAGVVPRRGAGISASRERGEIGDKEMTRLILAAINDEIFLARTAEVNPSRSRTALMSCNRSNETHLDTVCRYKLSLF